MKTDLHNGVPGTSEGPEMKTLQELLAEVRVDDAHLEANEYSEEPSTRQHFKTGHRAACDRLIPTLEIVGAILETRVATGAASEMEGYMLSQLHALLERRDV